MNKHIFLIAGEASGDSLGAGLMRELKTQTDSTVQFTGIGGEYMQAEGLDTLLPMEELCVMGIWEVIWQLPRLLKLIDAVVAEVEEHQPDVVVTIDLPDFNFRVAQKLKASDKWNGKLIHYVAPTVWAWRPKRAEKISALYDHLLCLFPFEPDHFTPHNLQATFVGHSLIENGLENADGQKFRRENDIAEDAEVLGLFFGSRESELKKMAATYMDTISILKDNNPDLAIIVPTLPSLEYDVLEVLRKAGCEATVVTNAEVKYDAFAACDVGLATSGTVGLELAYMGVPHIIAYKMHMVTFMLVKHMIKVSYAHLANILLDKPIVPEFLQMRCKPLLIGRNLLEFFKDSKLREGQRSQLLEVKSILQNENYLPSAKAAEVVLNI